MPNLLIEEERRADARLRKNAWYAAQKAADTPWYRNNLAKMRKWSREHPESNRAASRRWRLAHPEKAAELAAKSQKKILARCADCIVLSNLNTRFGLSGADRLKRGEVPQALLDAERTKVLLGRLLRKKRKKLEEQ